MTSPYGIYDQDCLPGLAELDRLCGRHNWFIIGVSTLLYDDAHVYLEVARPKYWKTTCNGRTIVTLGCIGGHLEPGERILDCLQREAQEEIGVPVRVIEADRTRIIFNGELDPGSFADGKDPLPWFYASSPYDQPEMTDKYAVIVTYLAEPLGTPRTADLYGLLAVPRGKLERVFVPNPLPVDEFCRITGARWMGEDVPAEALVEPILTARAIGCLPKEEFERRRF